VGGIFKKGPQISPKALGVLRGRFLGFAYPEKNGGLGPNLRKSFLKVNLGRGVFKIWKKFDRLFLLYKLFFGSYL